MEQKLTSKEKIALCDVILSINESMTITLPDGPSQRDKIITPVGINRDNYIRLVNAQGTVDTQYWSVDAAAFLSREEVLILQENNAYEKEVDDYINNGEG